MKPMDLPTLQALCQQLPFWRDPSDLQGLTVLTGPVRLRYANLTEKSAPPGTNKEPRFNALFLVPDCADSAALQDVANHAWATSPYGRGQPTQWPFIGQAQKGTGKDGKSIAGFGAESFGANSFCFSAESKNAVDCFDLYADPADPTRPARLPASAMYEGIWVRARVRAMPYSMGQNSGVKWWLSSLQKVADDKPLPRFDSAAGYTPLAPAGAGPAAMPSAGGFGGPASAAAPMAPAAPAMPQGGFGAPSMPAQGGQPAQPAWGRR